MIHPIPVVVQVERTAEHDVWVVSVADKSSHYWALQVVPLYQEQFFVPDETGVLTHILANDVVNDEQSVSILLQLLTQLHPTLAVQEFISYKKRLNI